MIRRYHLDLTSWIFSFHEVKFSYNPILIKIFQFLHPAVFTRVILCSYINLALSPALHVDQAVKLFLNFYCLVEIRPDSAEGLFIFSFSFRGTIRYANSFILWRIKKVLRKDRCWDLGGSYALRGIGGKGGALIARLTSHAERCG